MPSRGRGASQTGPPAIFHLGSSWERMKTPALRQLAGGLASRCHLEVRPPCRHGPATQSSEGKHGREKWPSSWARPPFGVKTRGARAGPAARAARRSEIYEARGLHLTNILCPEQGSI